MKSKKIGDITYSMSTLKKRKDWENHEDVKRGMDLVSIVWHLLKARPAGDNGSRKTWFYDEHLMRAICAEDDSKNSDDTCVFAVEMCKVNEYSSHIFLV